MKYSNTLVIFMAVCLISGLMADESKKSEAAEEAAEQKASENLPRTVEEARGRARWLHELIHGSLQVMHRDFFGDGDDDALSLPSQSLDDVFEEMARSWKVEIRWLGVNATKGIDHYPQDDFEEAAAKALENGAPEFDAVEGDKFRYVGAIKIQNQCLKCHVKDRTSLEDRVGGIAIGIPLLLAE